jgi:hypothetical protein
LRHVARATIKSKQSSSGLWLDERRCKKAQTKVLRDPKSSLDEFIEDPVTMPPKKKGAKPGGKDTEESQTRIAIVNADRCKPKKCGQECKKSCPVVKLGKLCIEVGVKSKLAFISEPLCIGTCHFIRASFLSAVCR